MTGQVNELQWYIARDGKQHGPLTDIEMRTFVAHNYLRQTDLIWRPGMPEWQAATLIFPAVFQPPAPAPAAPAVAPQAIEPQPAEPIAVAAPVSAQDSGFGDGPDAYPAGRPSFVKRAAIAAAMVTIVGGSAYGVAKFQEPLLKLVTGGATAPVKAPPADTRQLETNTEPAKTADPAQPAESPAAPPASPDTSVATSNPASVAAAETGAAASPAQPQADTQVATAAPAVSTIPPPPPSIAGSALDARLQKIPVWAAIKKDYPDWYTGNVAAADKLIADKKPESEVASQLAQGLVTLRRQNAEKALAAGPDKLRKIASAFLDHLKLLREQSVTSCFGYISKGETSPAVIQALQTPESATVFNALVGAILDAADDGSRTQAKHDVAAKADYDILIKELSKIGWKENDLQVFSNPKLLAQQEPAQVCKMVQEWFIAHLAISDKAVQNRLLYETLKPVVSG